MTKSEALKIALDKQKKQNDNNFQMKVEGLVWDIERASQKLRDLKKELTELRYEYPKLPDVLGCIE